MKKILFTILTFIFLIPIVNGLELDTYSENVLFYNVSDDSYIYEKNSDVKTPIASLTKIMTFLVAHEKIDNLDSKVIITSSDLKGLIEENASVAGFKENDIVTYQDLFYALMLPSGADAANALVRNTYLTEEAFINRMNELSNEIGLMDTHFATTTGLDTKGNYSTLKDLVKLLNYAIKDDFFYQVFTSATYKTSDNKLDLKGKLYFIQETYDYDYIIGAKSGTTDEAGLCLISLAQYKDNKFILVTTQAPKNYNVPYNIFDAIKIYDYFFNNYDYVTVIHKDDIIKTLETVNSTEKEIFIKSDRDINIYMEKNIDLSKIKYNYSGLEKLSYKNKIGDYIGQLDIIYGSNSLDKIDIFLNTKIHFNYLLIINPLVIIITTLLIVFIIKKLLEKKLKI